MRAIFIFVLAMLVWLAVLFLTADGPLSPVMAVCVLIAMTFTLYFPLRRRRNAWPAAALFSGVIAFLALIIAAVCT
jgi:hypothetical protein